MARLERDSSTRLAQLGSHVSHQQAQVSSFAADPAAGEARLQTDSSGSRHSADSAPGHDRRDARPGPFPFYAIDEFSSLDEFAERAAAASGPLDAQRLLAPSSARVAAHRARHDEAEWLARGLTRCVEPSDTLTNQAELRPARASADSSSCTARQADTATAAQQADARFPSKGATDSMERAERRVDENEQCEEFTARSPTDGTGEGKITLTDIVQTDTDATDKTAFMTIRTLSQSTGQASSPTGRSRCVRHHVHEQRDAARSR